MMDKVISQALGRARAKVRAHPCIGRSLSWLDEVRLRWALARQAGKKDLACLILMPGSLHLGLLALQHIGQYQNVILIANGLNAQEADIAGKAGNKNIIFLRTLLRHDIIIDSLVHSLHEPFWIVDHDCYLLNGSFFNKNTSEPFTAAGRAVFAFHNERLNTFVPETFLIQLNPGALRKVSKHFSVTAKLYRHEELPDNARRLLETAGWNARNYPEPHKSYYDTLRVLALLCPFLDLSFQISPGYSTRCEIHDEVVHIGNTSRPQWVVDPSFYNAIGAYFWKFSLGEREDIKHLEPYQNRNRHLPSLDHMRTRLLEAGCSPALLNRLELIAKGH